MDRNGRYAHLFRLQAQGYLEEDAPLAGAPVSRVEEAG
jgi:hypothetical protein